MDSPLRSLHVAADSLIQLTPNGIHIVGGVELRAPLTAEELSVLAVDDRIHVLEEFLELGAQTFRDRKIIAVDHLLELRIGQLTDQVSRDVVERIEQAEGKGLTKLSTELRQALAEAVTSIVRELTRDQTRRTETPIAGCTYQASSVVYSRVTCFRRITRIHMY